MEPSSEVDDAILPLAVAAVPAATTSAPHLQQSRDQTRDLASLGPGPEPGRSRSLSTSPSPSSPSPTAVAVAARPLSHLTLSPVEHQHDDASPRRLSASRELPCHLSTDDKKRDIILSVADAQPVASNSSSPVFYSRSPSPSCHDATGYDHTQGEVPSHDDQAGCQPAFIPGAASQGSVVQTQSSVKGSVPSALASRRSLSPLSRWAAQPTREGEVSFSSNNLDELPNEILMHILTFLDVCDLLATSRTNHHLRTLSLQPILHHHRLRLVRSLLPPLLNSPTRPTLSDLIRQHIFLTHTSQISRQLARNLVAIRLSRRLPLRPSAETLVERGVLPKECVEGTVSPGLVARKRAVEREKVKDGLRRWVGAVWRKEVSQKAEGVRVGMERRGEGRVWRLRRFWERVGREDGEGVR